MNAIPSSESQKTANSFSKIAGTKRLEKFGDFLIIDNLVKIYNGAYIHDDFFDMEVIAVQNMILVNKELSFLESQSNDIHRKTLKNH